MINHGAMIDKKKSIFYGLWLKCKGIVKIAPSLFSINDLQMGSVVHSDHSYKANTVAPLTGVTRLL